MSARSARMQKFAFATTAAFSVLFVIALLALNAAVVYAVFHFVTKFW